MTDRSSAVTPNIQSVADLVNRQVTGPTSFSARSGNVRCYLDAATAHRDIAERNWPATAARSTTATGITLSPGRPAQFVCAGGTTPSAGVQLGYRDSITAGTLRCESTGTGITCLDTRTRHGFTLSRAAYHLF